MMPKTMQGVQQTSILACWGKKINHSTLSVITYSLVHNVAFMHALLKGTFAGIKHKKSISEPLGVQQLPYCHSAHCAL